MKTIILTITVLISGSLIGQTKPTKLDYTKIEVSEAINDLQDFAEWTQQDIDFGMIDEKLGLLYIENYQQTIDRLMTVYNELTEYQLDYILKWIQGNGYVSK